MAEFVGLSLSALDEKEETVKCLLSKRNCSSQVAFSVRLHSKHACGEEWEHLFIVLVVMIGNHGGPFWS